MCSDHASSDTREQEYKQYVVAVKARWTDRKGYPGLAALVESSHLSKEIFLEFLSLARWNAEEVVKTLLRDKKDLARARHANAVRLPACRFPEPLSKYRSRTTNLKTFRTDRGEGIKTHGYVSTHQKDVHRKARTFIRAAHLHLGWVKAKKISTTTVRAKDLESRFFEMRVIGSPSESAVMSTAYP